MRCNILGVLLLTVGMIANGEAAVNKSGTQVRTTQKARTSQKTATTRAAKKKTTGTAKGTASARTGQSKAAQNVRPGTELLKVKTKVQEQEKPIVEKNIMVDFATTMGPIRIKLYDDTPEHRDNFEKLVKEGYYDGMLFHRVIDEFMVQTGDPNSKNAGAGEALGAGDPSYTLPAEIKYPEHYHKYGALAAARTGDQFNPQRRSSGSQFYIVTGQKYSREQLEKMNRAIREIYRILGEPEPMIEKRKFLVEMPDIGALVAQHGALALDMMQTYLRVVTPNVERRIRQQRNGEDYLYFYTEKHFMPDGAKWDTEKPISEKAYIRYLMEGDSALHSVRKTKYQFIYEGCRFELDVYPFSADRAVLFMYSGNADTPMPPEIKVLREVTGDPAYKNRQLARVQAL